MKTYTANVDLFLIDGEIHCFEENNTTLMDCMVTDDGFMPIAYSTTKADSCSTFKQLDRSLFVKGLDLEEMAQQYLRSEKISNSDFHRDIFKAGYQANKAEFTRDEMESVVNWIRVNPNRSLNDALYWLRPLSLPKSVTIDGDKITVNW